MASRLCVMGMLTGLAKQSNSWSQSVQWSTGLLEICESDSNANLDRRTSDGDRECSGKSRICESSKRCHERKWNVNQYIDARKNYND